MKELSIEEKAKRYDESLERANKVLLDCTSEEQNVVEYIFSELAESEDEKIRKEIISAIKEDWPGHKDWIAWLEKQGEQKRQIPLVKSVSTDFKNRLGTLMHYTSVDLEKEENKQLLNEAAKELLQLAYSDKANEIALASAKTWEESMAMLIAANNAYRRGQKEQKPIDKVEPKFKTGDWISGYYTNYKVLSVNNDGYVVEDVDGNKINILFENEKFHQLWTIQDAKDGDVLVASDNSIFLFKGTIDCACKHYVALTTDGAVKFNEGLEHYWETSRAVHPATKEQRDLLSQKMKEAGYEWDAEKKELKKIEQKPAWSEEDYIEIKRITGLLEGWASTFEKTFYEKECKRGVAWLKNLKDRVLPQSKQVWSEEDKDIWLEIKSLIDSLISEGENANYREYDLQKMWDWLDTIWQKDRIQTQPKQKWNGTEIAPPIDSDVCG